MATKKFSDMSKKACEYEAQAKRLRRAMKAEREKAYADVLASVYPEVADMDSEDEVRAFVARQRVYADALVASFPEVADMASEEDVRAAVAKVRQIYDEYAQRVRAAKGAASADGNTGESSTARPADSGMGYRE